MEPFQRLKLARERAGYDSARAAASAIGVSADTYSQHENGTRGFKGRAERYARFFRVAPEWLLYGRGDGSPQAMPVPINRMVPVLGEVQAGAWHSMIEDPEPLEEIPMVLPGFEGARLFALRVVGPSMNVHYPEGTIVVCCPAAEVGVRDGDHVIVENRRNGMVETTVKEVVQEKNGVSLWPRSTDPAFQSPVRFVRNELADDGLAITAVVVSSYVIRPVQRKALLHL
jgi:SOS-response transcriptional repressor LexA